MCKFAWSNCPKKAGINCFYKELHVATVPIATIIICDANDVAGVWGRVLQIHHYHITINSMAKHVCCITLLGMDVDFATQVATFTTEHGEQPSNVDYLTAIRPVRQNRLSDLLEIFTLRCVPSFWPVYTAAVSLVKVYDYLTCS